MKNILDKPVIRMALWSLVWFIVWLILVLIKADNIYIGIAYFMMVWPAITIYSYIFFCKVFNAKP